VDTVFTIWDQSIIILHPSAVARDMGIRGAFTRLLPGDRTVVVVECRQCGTTVDPATDQCPECGAVELCRYEIKG
jgi:uncharacterized OB-fold protein